MVGSPVSVPRGTALGSVPLVVIVEKCHGYFRWTAILLCILFSCDLRIMWNPLIALSPGMPTSALCRVGG